MAKRDLRFRVDPVRLPIRAGQFVSVAVIPVLHHEIDPGPAVAIVVIVALPQRSERIDGGFPVVALESHVTEAVALANRATTIKASPTGTAGLAGVLAMRDEIDDNENIAIVFSGVARR